MCRKMVGRKVLIIFVVIIVCVATHAQFTTVELNQGVLVGLKVFPESSKVSVYSFLGIPYAKPPTNDLRFMPPVSHPGWNQTLLARNFQSLCPQLDQSPYEEVPGPNYPNPATQMSEDCLYLNIWTPETGFRVGNLPVVAVITGEEMAFDWLTNRPTGLDLAAEGVVVVTIQYRTNIFGWLAVPGSENLAILDQIEGLKWIKDNIKKFGGDPSKVTVLGHGTTGAACAMIHLTSKLSQDLFSGMIISSGTVFSSYSFQPRNGSDFFLGPTRRVVLNLACDAAEVRFTLECLKRKSTNDLLRAFENVYKVGNYTQLLGPVIDGKVITEDPRLLIQSGEFKRVPILIGLCNQEGAYLKDNWLAFARQGPRVLREFIQNTIIPNILEHNSFSHGLQQIKEAIEWRYFEEVPRTVPYYMNALQTLVSETHFEIPFFESIELLGSRDKMDNFFVYTFQQYTPIDMRGRVNYFGGAQHGSDLPILLGPSLLQQIARRRLTQSEDKMSKTMKSYFGDFIKFGNPTPGRIFDSWKTYSADRKFIKILSSSTDNIEISSGKFGAVERNLEMLEYHLGTPEEEGTSVPNPNEYSTSSYLNDEHDLQYHSQLLQTYSFWRKFLVRIAKNAKAIDDDKKDRQAKQSEIALAEFEGVNQKFKHAFFSMLTLTCLLLAILLICVYLLKKNNDTSFTRDSGGRSGYL